MQAYDRGDQFDYIKRRTQAKGEKITLYLTSLKYIVSRFARLLPESEIVDKAWRNLLAEYRKVMGDKFMDSLSLLEKYGRRWNRQKELCVQQSVCAIFSASRENARAGRSV